MMVLYFSCYRNYSARKSAEEKEEREKGKGEILPLFIFLI
jgi:hypothetical protein